MPQCVHGPTNGAFFLVSSLKLSQSSINLGEYLFKYFTTCKTLKVSHTGGLWYFFNGLHFLIPWLVTIRCRGSPKDVFLFGFELELV